MCEKDFVEGAELERNVHDPELANIAQPSTSKGARFWLIFLAICVSLFLSALEFVSGAFRVQLPQDIR